MLSDKKEALMNQIYWKPFIDTVVRIDSATSCIIRKLLFLLYVISSRQKLDIYPQTYNKRRLSWSAFSLLNFL